MVRSIPPSGETSRTLFPLRVNAIQRPSGDQMGFRSVWGRGIKFLVRYMSFVLAIPEFVVRHGRRGWVARRDRNAAHEFVVTRIGKNERELDGFIARVFKTDPGVGRNENNSPRVNVPFLRAQPNVCTACLNQQNLVLAEMLVLRDYAAWRNFFRT